MLKLIKSFIVLHDSDSAHSYKLIKL